MGREETRVGGPEPPGGFQASPWLKPPDSRPGPAYLCPHLGTGPRCGVRQVVLTPWGVIHQVTPGAPGPPHQVP